MIYANRVRELLSYNEVSGDIVRLGGPMSGQKAGSNKLLNGRNLYNQLTLEGRRYLAHRVAFLLKTGFWPLGIIDHIDGDGLNNSWANLRVTDTLGNSQNQRLQTRNKSGCPGVYKQRDKWIAKIGHNGKLIHLGTFDSLSAAIQARRTAERSLGFHPNHGARK